MVTIITNQTNQNSLNSTINNYPVALGGPKNIERYETDSEGEEVKSEDFDQGLRINKAARRSKGGHMTAR